MNIRYYVPTDWKQVCDGQKCRCGAHADFECTEDDIDWTPRKIYELKNEVNSLIAENDSLRMGLL